MSDIRGKVILILGGAGGIGSATAQDLAAKGAKIAIADISEAKAAIVAMTIRNAGGEARAYLVDVTDKEQVKALVDRVIGDFGSLEVLINCAGIMFIRPLIEVDTKDLDLLDTKTRMILLSASPIALKDIYLAKLAEMRG